LQRLDRSRIRVEGDALEAGARESSHHVGAHATKSDEAEFFFRSHVILLVNG
jgi:hypothetical protein